jgi:ABC-type nitrate/sulfonate/bicarbonate transport system substrate-binding protein
MDNAREETMSFLRRLSGALVIAALAMFSLPAVAQQKLTDAKIVFPAPSSTSWPIWLATDGGYFAKYGLNMKIEMAMHPAGPAAVVAGEALTHNLGLDSSMLAAMKGEQLVLVSSPLQVGQFVLVGTKDIGDAKSLAGKRIAVGRVGDPPYHYAQGLLQHLGVDQKNINWISAGAPPQRALALRNNMADAAMITAPDYYKLLDDGFKAVAYLADHREVPVATSYMFRRRVMTEQPQLIEAVLKAHAEAVKRFYDDKPFAMATIRKYAGINDDAILSRLYDETVKSNVLERIPYVPARAVKGIIERDKAQVPELATFDFRKVIRQDFIDRLADQGFYQQVFGPGIAAELADRRAAAFR